MQRRKGDSMTTQATDDQQHPVLKKDDLIVAFHQEGEVPGSSAEERAKAQEVRLYPVCTV
jgi:hypothetical protein